MIFEYCGVLACLRYSSSWKDVHSHTRTVYNYEIDFHLKGNRRIILDGEEYKIDINTCVLRRPGQTVTGIGKEMDAYCLTLTFFEDEAGAFESRKAQRAIGKALRHPVLDSLPSVFSVDNAGAVKDLFEGLSHLCLSSLAQSEEKSRLAEKLLLLLASEAIPVKKKKRAPNPKCEIIRKLITENFEADFSVSDAAKESGFSEEHLIRLFKADFLCTPKDFLIRVRMENALHALISSDIPISEIALMCGYCNFSFFSATFKKRFGMTPSEYRKKKA